MISFKDAVSVLTPGEEEIAAALEARIDNAIRDGKPEREEICVDVTGINKRVLDAVFKAYSKGGWHLTLREPAGSRGTPTLILRGA